MLQKVSRSAMSFMIATSFKVSNELHVSDELQVQVKMGFITSEWVGDHRTHTRILILSQKVRIVGYELF